MKGPRRRLPGRLTPKQERFVAEYLVDMNATQAAIRAGYSRKTADVQGPRLLGNVRIMDVRFQYITGRSKHSGIDVHDGSPDVAAVAEAYRDSSHDAGSLPLGPVAASSAFAERSRGANKGTAA